MNDDDTRPRPGRLLGLALALGGVLLVAISLVVVTLAQRSVQQLPVLAKMPRFTLTERSGHPFGATDLRDQIAIFELMFTSCPDVCPVMDQHFAQLYRAFADTELVRLVSITVDPERDTPEVLDAHASQLGVEDDRWVFLRGTQEEVKRLATLGLKLPTGELPLGHSTRFTLVDGDGQIRGSYDGRDPASVRILMEHVRQLVKAQR